MTTLRHTVALPRAAAASQTANTSRAVAATSLRQFSLIVVALIVALSAALMALNVSLVHGAFTAQALHKESQRLERAQQSLGDAVAAAEAPGRLAQAAEKLGMQPAVKPVFLSLPARGSHRVNGGAHGSARVEPAAAVPH
ncbi:MAG: hypothetical protein KGP01_00665 [Actinomycetales bacterium]|nr:hypothetical protein [Actinomycetales bacterium]